MNKLVVTQEAKIKEIVKKKALVSYNLKNEEKVVVAKLNCDKKVGDAVTLFKANKYNLAEKISLVLLPLALFLIGFGVGFIFKNDVYHYVLALSCAALGFFIVLITKLIVSKRSLIYYFCE